MLIRAALIALCVAGWFIIQLFKNMETGPWTFERAFSKNNIKETIILLIIAAAVVIPLRVVYLRMTDRKTPD